MAEASRLAGKVLQHRLTKQSAGGAGLAGGAGRQSETAAEGGAVRVCNGALD